MARRQERASGRDGPLNGGEHDKHLVFCSVVLKTIDLNP
jgi:hypothetical protein